MRRKRAEWQQPLDDQILELLSESGLILSPSIIAVNLDRSRTGVAHRITTLSEYGLVRKVARGKYQITESGEKYLEGELDASDLEKTE